MKIEEVNKYADFITLRDSWQAVLQRCDHTIFSTWEYLSTWWKYYGKNANLKVLLAQENRETLSIAPLMISNYTVSHLGSLHKLQFLGHGSDCADFIIPNENTKFLELFLDDLLQFSEWDILELEGINEESTSARTLLDLQNNYTPKLELNDWFSNYYVSLSNSFNVFINGLRRKLRRELDRTMRRLVENYKVEFTTQHDFNSVEVAMETFFDLHQMRWKSKGEDGVFANEVNRDFHISLAKTFNEKGWLALYFLTVDDEPISAVYTFDYNQKKYACLSGLDPEFRKFGVGNLLHKHIIEECFRKRFREYNLGRGFMQYKTQWATGVRKNLGMTITKGGWRVPFLLWIKNFKTHFHI